VSNIIFPAGLTIDYSDLSMEMVQHYSKKWNLEHTQIGKGVFRGKITVVHTPRIQLAANSYTTGLLTRGDIPKGCILLHSYIQNDIQYTVQNKSILPNELVVMTERDKVDRMSSGPFGTHSITIEKQLFHKAFYAFFEELPYQSLKTERFYIKENMISNFHQTVSSWIDYLINTLPELDTTPEYEKIEYEILSELFSCIAFTSLKKDRKKFHIDMVRDFLHQNIYEDIDLTMITEKFNISESQLHNAFKSNYGISPKKYLQMLRLNAVRKELLLADPKHDTVSEIAMKYNFLSMNHFSDEYKKIFGQTPSQTLGK
jgi:AraC family ethanolamine operon transcriptional activator